MRRIAYIIALLGVIGCGDNATPAVDLQTYEPAQPTPLECIPNLDGTISEDELGAALGIPISYRVSAAGVMEEVDLAGGRDQDGIRVWDWSDNRESDRALEIQADGLEGKWYADNFPQGQFVTPLDAGGRQEAIYRRDESGLYLLGFASASEEPANEQTLMVYTDEVLLYPFPLTVGDTWVSTGEVVNGKVLGLPYASRDVYENTVEESGELWLPDISFKQALKVNTKLTISPAVGESVTRRQVSFLFECFGEVARATSQDNETNENFTTASEIRRLGLN